MKIIVISGMSGSGKSTAVKALEDCGFYCIDNLPIRLFKPFVELINRSTEKFNGIVLVADIRGREFLKGYAQVLKKLPLSGYEIQIIFIDASDETLIRRFSETRRRHPISESCTISEGIRAERQQLTALRQMADQIIDTSELNVHQLKDYILRIVKGEYAPQPFLIDVQSFGFKYGIPMESNLVIDVRFLPNPFFVPELKKNSGLDDAVREYVIDNKITAAFLDRFFPLIDYMVPLYQKEGKAYLTISIGCTGGRHRSVALADATHLYLSERYDNVRAIHRDIDKGQ